MAGRPGRSGGHNRLDARLHVLRGTYNATRHGAALAGIQTTGAPWHPTPAELAKLGPDGQAFVARLRAAFELNVWEGELVVEAAVATDRLAQLRRDRDACDVKTRLTLNKTEQVWQKQLTTLLLALRIRP
jgi:hypothetical protein